MITKENKLLAISCLQKAVRRGLTDIALNYAKQMWQIERSYVTFRLSVMAIEDIGIGNIDTMYDFFNTEIKKDNINALGGWDYVEGIIKSLCESQKDRSACDLSYLSALHSFEYINKNNANKYLEEGNLAEKTKALWEILGGKKHKTSFLNNTDEDNLDLLLKAIEKYFTTNEKILTITEKAHKIHREQHFMALAICFSEFESQKGQKIKNYTVGDSVEVNLPYYMLNESDNQWLNVGMDKHSKEGSGFIFKFLKQKSHIKSYLQKLNINYQDYLSIIGHMQFRMEGHEVDKRLFYPSAVSIMQKAHQQPLSLIDEQLNFKELKSLFLQDWDLFEQLRMDTFKNNYQTGFQLKT